MALSAAGSWDEDADADINVDADADKDTDTEVDGSRVWLTSGVLDASATDGIGEACNDSADWSGEHVCSCIKLSIK
jgi:hypothetical protein